eukprot:1851595-Pleurochrysis_carterae.AAC.1
MAALGLEWQQLMAPACDGAAEGDADKAAGARGGALAAAWLAGASDDPVLTRRLTTQLGMVGMAAATTMGGGMPWRGVAQFAAAGGGEAQAPAAAEAALLAAQAADEGRGEAAGDETQRLAAARLA